MRRIVVDIHHTTHYMPRMATSLFTIRLAEEDRRALERAAQADDRTVSALTRKIISDWLRKQSKAPKR